MGQEDPLAELTLKSISGDHVGRVIVTDPVLIGRLRDIVGTTPQSFDTGNCYGCNSVRGCG